MGIFIPGSDHAGRQQEQPAERTSEASSDLNTLQVERLQTFTAATPQGIAMEHLALDGSTIALPEELIGHCNTITGFKIHQDSATFDATLLREGPAGTEYSGMLDVTIFWEGGERTGFDKFPVTVIAQTASRNSLENNAINLDEQQLITAA